MTESRQPIFNLPQVEEETEKNVAASIKKAKGWVGAAIFLASVLTFKIVTMVLFGPSFSRIESTIQVIVIIWLCLLIASLYTGMAEIMVAALGVIRNLTPTYIFRRHDS